MLTSLLFGFSTSLYAAIAIRALAGLGNGNGGILRTMAAELVTDKALQPRVFSIMPLAWNIGSFIGPAIGGGLADPARKYPRVFGSVKLFKLFPYALPNLNNSVLFGVSIVTGFLFLHETLAAKRDAPDYGLRLGDNLTSCCVGKRGAKKETEGEEERLLQPDHPGRGGDPATAKPRPAVPFSWKAVFSSQSRVNLLESFLLGMHCVAFDHLLPVYMHHPRSTSIRASTNPLRFSGGFGLDSSQIGFLLMLNGVCGMFIQFVIFPSVAKRFGVLRCLKVCTMAFAILYVLMPFTALISSATIQQSVALALIIGKTCLTVFAFPCNAILLTNSSASANTLGTLNGVATSVAAIGRTIGPLVGGWMFSVGVEAGYIVLPWWSIAALAALGALPVFWMEDMPALNSEIVENENIDDVQENDQADPRNPK